MIIDGLNDLDEMTSSSSWAFDGCGGTFLPPSSGRTSGLINFRRSFIVLSFYCSLIEIGVTLTPHGYLLCAWVIPHALY